MEENKRPNKKDYGYVESTGSFDKKTLLTKGMREESYKQAMKKWKQKEGRLCFETGIRDKINYCKNCHLYSECN